MPLDIARDVQTLTGPEAREALALVLALPGVPQGLSVRGLLRHVRAGRDRLKALAAEARLAAATNAIGSANEIAFAAAAQVAAAQAVEIAAARSDLVSVEPDYGPG